MPKYYVTDPEGRQTVIEGGDAIRAVVNAFQHRFLSFITGPNCFFRVSERGFEMHEDDNVFTSDFVIDHIWTNNNE